MSAAHRSSRRRATAVACLVLLAVCGSDEDASTTSTQPSSGEVSDPTTTTVPDASSEGAIQRVPLTDPAADGLLARFADEADARELGSIEIRVAVVETGRLDGAGSPERRPVFTPTIVAVAPGQQLEIVLVDEPDAFSHNFTMPAADIAHTFRQTSATELVSFPVTAPTEGAMYFFCTVHPGQAGELRVRR